MNLALQGLMVRRDRVPTPDLHAIASESSGGANTQVTRFSPNNNFVACGTGDAATKELIIYSWNGTDTLTEVETVNTNAYLTNVDWHPNGNFLAVAQNDAINSIIVYSWNGSDTLTEVETIAYADNGTNVHWHPNGNFLATTSKEDAHGINVYSWNGTDTLTEVEVVNAGGDVYGVRWSDDGDYLAVGTNIATKQFQVYSWNGTDTLALIDSYNTSDGYSHSVRWDSGNYYLYGAIVAGTNQIYSLDFNGSALSLIQAETKVGDGGIGLDIYNDKYLIMGLAATSTTTQELLYLYEINRVDGTLTKLTGYSENARAIYRPGFNSDGTQIAIPVTLASDSETIRVLDFY